MKNLNQKQINCLENNWYGIEVRTAYARLENGKLFDYHITFEDGSIVWLDAHSNKGKVLTSLG